jgi:hypothetical protein
MRELLEGVRRGEVPVEAAFERLRGIPVRDLGHTRFDVQREARCGAPEVVFAEGKTPAEVLDVTRASLEHHGRALATRCGAETLALLARELPGVALHERARCAVVDPPRNGARAGRVLVVSAGTSDAPVAEEALVTARFLGAEAELLVDVGVAGIHRLLAHERALRAADALVVVAGMEGALPSVVAGLVDAPVVAVPTSVGYGASLGGLAALLAMLNACAAGVTVVNIDNGFGAGFAAARIAVRARKEGR